VDDGPGGARVPRDIYGEDGLRSIPLWQRRPIGADVVQLIDEVYEAHTLREPWQAGDLLLVDNIRTAHRAGT